jgi:hypothetical protein
MCCMFLSDALNWGKEMKERAYQPKPDAVAHTNLQANLVVNFNSEDVGREGYNLVCDSLLLP